MRRSRTLAIASISLVLLALQGCGIQGFRAKQTISQTMNHVAGSSLNVQTRNGAVLVTVDPARTDVQIEAKIVAGGSTQAEADTRLSQVTIDISYDTARQLIVKPIFPEPRRNGDGASLTIALPSVNDVDVTTSNGSVNVSHADGEVVIDTSNGSIKLFDIEGPCTLDTSNGAITLSSIRGDLEVDTSNGSITGTELGGAVNISTSNGEVRFKLSDDATGPTIVRTSNGAINVTVSNGYDGEFTMNTSNGRVTINEMADNAVSAKVIMKSSAQITLGEGGAASKLTTSNGRITFTIVEKQ